MFVLVNFLLAVIKYLDGKQLMEERICFGLRFQEDRTDHSGEGMGAEAGSWLIASSSTCRGREEKERWGGNRQKWNWAQSKLSVRYFLLLGTLERLHSSPESTTALGPSVQIGSLRGTSFKPQSCAPVAPPYGSQKNMKTNPRIPQAAKNPVQS